MNWFRIKISFFFYQGLSEPEFYGDIVYIFKTIMDRTEFSDQFRKIIIRHKRISYDLNVIHKKWFEPRHEKTGLLHMQTQRRRSASR